MLGPKLVADGLVRALVRALVSRGVHDFAEGSSLGRVALHVDALLAQRPQHAFDLRELVDATGVSERTLRRATQAWYGVPPLTLAQRRRLNGVRRVLIAADSSKTNVTGVAMHWEFSHLGRFAGEYRDLFGELPSETLERRGPGIP